MKLCECGCGRPTPLAKRTNSGWSHVKGRPLRFIPGHENRGRHGWKDAPERFWAKVKKAGPKDCWEWQGAKAHYGYGSFRIGYEGWTAHRVSWILHRGLIPEGMHVLHKCDNPPCVNPAHLYLGTHRQNMKDMWIRGRAKLPDNRGDRNPMRLHPESVKRGEKNNMAKLTAEAVAEIRSLYQPRKNGQELARRFGVSLSLLVMVAKGKSWRHLPV